MKANSYTAASALLLTLCAMTSPLASAQGTTNPSVPCGTLSASPTVVQTGVKTNLTWNINYPAAVLDYVEVTPPGTVTVKQNLYCDVRILGAGVTTQDSKGNIIFIRTKGLITGSNGSSWATLFDGKQTDLIVQQQGIILSFLATPNKPIDFGGQYYFSNSWSTFRSSQSGTLVKALVNGDHCPSRVPDYNAPSLEKFLKPYLDASNNVKIGPMDVIVFMELTHTNMAYVGYDEQDLVFLVSFRKP